MFLVYFDCLNEKVEIQLSQEHEKLTCGSFTIASGTLETIWVQDLQDNKTEEQNFDLIDVKYDPLP